MSRTSLELREVVCAVTRLFPLKDLTLPDEFFPANLSVALIDAVFRSMLDDARRAEPGAERYCHRFGIPRTRASRWELPPVMEQESIEDFIRRSDELGKDRMVDEVFRSRQRFPGDCVTRAERVLRAAMELRRIDANVLQDVSARSPEEVEAALRPALGPRESAIRMFQMYSGEDDFVRGDVHVRRFVASALGRQSIAAGEAVELVRMSAYELALAPRYLDREIWNFGVSFVSIAK